MIWEGPVFGIHENKDNGPLAPTVKKMQPFFERIKEHIGIDDEEAFTFLLEKSTSGEDEATMAILAVAFEEAFTLTKLTFDVPDFKGDRNREIERKKQRRESQKKQYEIDARQFIEDGFEVVKRRRDFIVKIRDIDVRLSAEDFDDSSDFTILNKTGFLKKSFWSSQIKLFNDRLFEGDYESRTPILRNIPWFDTVNTFPSDPTDRYEHFGMFQNNHDQQRGWETRMAYYIENGFQHPDTYRHTGSFHCM